MVRILLADDHTIFAEALSAVLNASGRIEVVGTAANGEEALRMVEEGLEIDLLVLDISMPVMDGLTVLAELRRRGRKLAVLMLSQELLGSTITRAMRAGAAGYMLKTAPYDELVRAIDEIAAGHEYLSEGAKSALIATATGRSKIVDESLTRRELEILRLIASGSRTSDIAEQLFISTATVETHRHNLMQKLGLKNVAGLVRYAIEHDLADP